MKHIGKSDNNTAIYRYTEFSSNVIIDDDAVIPLV